MSVFPLKCIINANHIPVIIAKHCSIWLCYLVECSRNLCCQIPVELTAVLLRHQSPSLLPLSRASCWLTADVRNEYFRRLQGLSCCHHPFFLFPRDVFWAHAVSSASCKNPKWLCLLSTDNVGYFGMFKRFTTTQKCHSPFIRLCRIILFIFLR